MKFAFLILSFLFISIFNNFAKASEAPLKELLAGAIGEARLRSKCISVAIVGADGQLAYFERMSCAHIGSIETSIQKAISANAFRKSTSDFARAVSEGNNGILGARNVMAVSGGVPVKIGGNFIGAIGVGGATADEDEQIAKSTLSKIMNF